MHTCPTYDKMFAVSSSRSTLRTQERLILKKKMKRTIEVAVDNALCIGTLENMYTLTQFFSCSWVVFYESNDREKYPHASYFRQTNTCTEFSVYWFPCLPLTHFSGVDYWSCADVTLHGHVYDKLWCDVLIFICQQILLVENYRFFFSNLRLIPVSTPILTLCNLKKLMWNSKTITRSICIFKRM